MCDELDIVDCLEINRILNRFFFNLSHKSFCPELKGIFDLLGIRILGIFY